MSISNGPYDVGQRKYGTGNEAAMPQIRTDYYKKRALIETVKDSVFSPMADATAMPKHFGKTIKQYHYLPLLDDRNINDQGIDASGASSTMGVTIQIAWAGVAGKAGFEFKAGQMHGETVKGEGASAGAALTDAQAKADAVLAGMGFEGADYAARKSAAETAGFFVDESAAYPVTGNLYGSSKDVGSIAAKLPVLSEHGGRVNRVGFRRIEIEGSIEKFGFFDEYTQESLDFDTDEELLMHVHREMLRGANEITEDMIQSDLLQGAGVVMFAGDATSNATLSPEGDVADEVTYDDFVKLGIELTNNRTPRQTKVISGSRMIDTKVIDGGYVMFVGSELLPTLKRLVDFHGERAFVEAKHYAAAGTLMKGEVGSIDHFRIVVAQEMQHWAGEGDTVGTNPGYRETAGKYDVFPMLVIGQGAFTTIGFQTDGNGVKFTIKHEKPGKADKIDPYGETGFMSIKWYYGSMILRPERLALIKTVARWQQQSLIKPLLVEGFFTEGYSPIHQFHEELTMSERNKPTEEEMLQALKNKADMLSITYHPSIGLDKLKEKVDAKMAEQPTVDPLDSGTVPVITGGKSNLVKRKDATRLVRVMVNSRDPNKKDWPGEIISVGNSTLGFFKKYIPYGAEWHVPQIILNTLRDKKVQVFIPKVDSKGNKTKVPKLINAYNIEELEPLTAQELAELATAQQASGRIEDE